MKSAKTNQSKAKTPIRVVVPGSQLCCTNGPDSFLVTHRRAKQLERPRQHACRKCGARYEINMTNNPPKVTRV